MSQKRFAEIVTRLGKKPLDPNDVNPEIRHLVVAATNYFTKLIPLHIDGAIPGDNIFIGFLEQQHSFNAYASSKIADVIAFDGLLFVALTGVAQLLNDRAGAYLWWIRVEPTSSNPEAASDRQTACEFIRQSMFMFYFFHEVAHIRHGHTRYFKEQGIDEFDVAYRQWDVFDRQTCEFDADRYATFNVLLGAFDQREQYLIPNNSWERIFGAGITRYITALSAILLAWGMRDDEANTYRSSTATHPPNLVRMRLIIETANEICRDRLGQSMDKAKEICAIAFRQAAEMKTALSGKRPYWATAPDMFSSSVDTTVARFYINLKRLQPLLEPFARVPASTRGNRTAES